MDVQREFVALHEYDVPLACARLDGECDGDFLTTVSLSLRDKHLARSPALGAQCARQPIESLLIGEDLLGPAAGSIDISSPSILQERRSGRQPRSRCQQQ